VCVGCVVFFFFSTGVLNQDLMLARQVLYHLSHGLRSFCFSYFLHRVSSFSQAGLRPRSSYLYLPCRWNYRHAPSNLNGRACHSQLFHRESSFVSLSRKGAQESFVFIPDCRCRDPLRSPVPDPVLDPHLLVAGRTLISVLFDFWCQCLLVSCMATG
jgi:hypothetical protein